MTESGVELLREYELRQESERLAKAAIEMASGPKHAQHQERLGYLVTYFGHRADVPEMAVLCKMGPEVVANLARLGLTEPVSLRGLAGKWWHAYVDAAWENPNREPGGWMITVIASTDDLLHEYTGYYREVFAGPFDRKEDVK